MTMDLGSTVCIVQFVMIDPRDLENVVSSLYPWMMDDEEKEKDDEDGGAPEISTSIFVCLN